MPTSNDAHSTAAGNWTELNWTELNWDSKALSYESVTEGVAGKQFHEKYTRRFDSCNTHSDQGWPEVKNR